jgi:hypothetical protein
VYESLVKRGGSILRQIHGKSLFAQSLRQYVAGVHIIFDN